MTHPLPPDYYIALRFFYSQDARPMDWGDMCDGACDLGQILDELIKLTTATHIIAPEQPSLQTLKVWRFQDDVPPRDVTEDVLDKLAEALAEMGVEA